MNGLQKHQNLTFCKSGWTLERYHSGHFQWYLENDHHIATIRKPKRDMTREPNPKLKPDDFICLDIIQNTSRTSLTSSTMYKYFLLTVDAYSWMPKIKGLYGVSTSEIIDTLTFNQVQLYNLKFHTELHITSRIWTDFGTVYISDQFQQFCHKLNLTQESPKHLEMNSILERIYQSLALIKNNLLVQARVDKSFTYFGLCYVWQIFSTIPICTLQKENWLITQYKSYTDMCPMLR